MNNRIYYSKNSLINSVIKTDSGYVIEGYACHWNEMNHNGEMVTRNSFDRFFKELENGGQMPMLNLYHWPVVIGCWDSLESDNETGLYVKGRIEDTNFICKNYVLPLVEMGALRSLSTQGRTMINDIEATDDGLMLKHMELTAVSLVGLPADFGATINNDFNLYAKKAKVDGSEKMTLNEFLLNI